MDRSNEVRTWLDQQADEMADLLEELVAIDTQNPPGRNLGRAARAVATAMERLGIESEVIDLPPSGDLDEPAIVRGIVGSGSPLVYFHGHFDVVPVQDQQQLRAERRAGRIIGRGTADMKGGIVSMLFGAAAAQDLGFLRHGRVILHLVCDEETGSTVGSGHLRAANMIDPAALAMVTAEQSGGAVWNTARGALSVRVTIQGREAHVGQAIRGVNAFEQMLHVARPVEAYAREMAARATTAATGPDVPSGSMIVVGGSSGSGANFNVVPGSAWFTIDARFNPEENIDGELARLGQIINAAALEIGADVTLDVFQRGDPAKTDANHPAAATLAEVVAEVEGVAPRFELCAGVLETHWYADLGIPAFGYGAGRLDVSHGPDEYVDEAALRRCAAVYALYAGAMLA